MGRLVGWGPAEPNARGLGQGETLEHSDMAICPLQRPQCCAVQDSQGRDGGKAKTLGRWKPGLEACTGRPSTPTRNARGWGTESAPKSSFKAKELPEILLPSLTQYQHWSSARTESCLHCELTYCPVTLGESHSVQCSRSSGATGFVWVLSLSPSPSLLRIPAPDMLRLWQSLQIASGIKGLLQGQTSPPNPHGESTTTTEGCSTAKFWERNQSSWGRQAFVCNVAEGSSVPPRRKPQTPPCRLSDPLYRDLN